MHRRGVYLGGLVLCLNLLSTGVPAVELAGELHWGQRVDLSVPLSGRIAQVAVQAGSAVEADQLLVAFDQRIVEARLRAAQAQLKDKQLQRAEAQREWDRAKELYDRTVLSERELQLAENLFAAADAQYQNARAGLVAAQVELEYARVTAPFSAWVLAVHVVPGQAVVNHQIAMPLVTLVERERMRVHSRLTSEQVAALADQRSVQVRIGDQYYPGRVLTVGLEPIANERPALYAIEIEVAVPTGKVDWRAGQAVSWVLP